MLYSDELRLTLLTPERKFLVLSKNYINTTNTQTTQGVTLFYAKGKKVFPNILTGWSKNRREKRGVSIYCFLAVLKNEFL